MSHPSEDELVLHYYAEAAGPASVEPHLSECEECRALYSSLERTLTGIHALAVPEPDAGYEARVWRRVEASLAPRFGFRFRTPPWRWAAAGVAFAGLLVAAFQIGRFYPPGRMAAPAAVQSEARERLLLVAVGDHLERSQRMLTELANAGGPRNLDISDEQQRAADLVEENRLYRQTALRSGDAVLAGVLDELERVLLEIAHSPARLSPGELDDLRSRLRTEGLLFKLRVLGATVRNRRDAPAQRPI